MTTNSKNTENEYIHCYTGGIVDIKNVQSLFEENKIPFITKDSMKSGVMAGFGGIPDAIQLFVKKEFLSKGQEIIRNSGLNVQH